MRWVRPAIFKIARTEIVDSEVNAWLTFIGCDPETVTKYTERYRMVDNVIVEPKTAAERLVELAGRRCYLAFQVGMNPNVTRIREEITAYIDNILASGHGSVIEHPSASYAIENVSRVCTAEMNRHRAGWAISEGSMRFIRYNDIPIVEVPSLRVPEDDDHEHWQQVMKSREIIETAVSDAEVYYDNLRVTWEDVLNGKEFKGKKHITSMMRRIIPMGVATGGVWTGNIRALRHMVTMRCSPAAEEEILEVAEMILEKMIKDEPTLFGDFKRDEIGFYEPKYRKV